MELELVATLGVGIGGMSLGFAGFAFPCSLPAPWPLSIPLSWLYPTAPWGGRLALGFVVLVFVAYSLRTDLRGGRGRPWRAAVPATGRLVAVGGFLVGMLLRRVLPAGVLFRRVILGLLGVNGAALVVRRLQGWVAQP